MEPLIILAHNNAPRLDKFISENSNLTRTHAQSLINDERVLLNNKPANKKMAVSIGDTIVIDLPEPQTLNITPENLSIDIIYNDDDVAVINKPQGMVVHPGAGNYTGTLVNALMYHFGSSLSGINGVIRPGIVHRIDKDTSGLLMIAKNDAAHISLASQFKSHKTLRKYYTLVYGHLKQTEGTVNKPIGRHPVDRKKMAIIPDGREAITHYKVLEEYPGYSLVECVLETGRTHQIRVHLSSIGHPIVGDELYSHQKPPFRLTGQLLHAKTLAFNHPKTGELLNFDSDLPEYFINILTMLRNV